MSIIALFTGVGVDPQVVSAVGRTTTLVRVTFNEAMTDDAELQDPTNYTVIPTGAGSTPTVIGATPQTGGSPLYVDLTLDLAMSNSAEYEATVDTAVTDLAGNPLDAAADSALFTSPTEGVVALSEVGLLEALTGIFGEEHNEVGGLRLTKTNAVISATDAIFPVETTHEWPDTGKVALDGVVYYYTGKTASTFTGITHTAAGATVVGARIQHRVETTVVDLSREYSAMDLLRRGFLVNYAEGDDLSTLGRNLGVDRLPIFKDDDQFRAVIKALAYSPRGTMLALEAALEAFVGAGNFEIYEDLILYPNTVFIRIAASYFAGEGSLGKAFFNPVEWDQLAGSQDTLVLSREPLAVGSVILKDLEELFNFETQKPSALTYEYWPDETPASAFTYAGGESEATQVTVITDTGVELVSGAGGTVFYEMLDTQGARIENESYAEVSSLLMIPTGAVIGADKNQASVSIKDGAFEVNVGVDGSGIGLFSSTGGGFLGSTLSTALDTWYEVVVKKFGTDYVELWVNGTPISRVNYSLFVVASVDHQVEWGIRGAPSVGMKVQVRQVGFEIKTITDYWNARGVAGSVNTANPTRFDDTLALMTAGDVGKQLQVSGGTVASGINNGTWVISSYVSPGVVELQGVTHTDEATVSTGPDTVTVEDLEAFTYPDDIGKTIVITGSVGANDGSYTITALIEPGTLTDFSTYDTPVTGAKTNIAEVAGAPPFVPEPNLEYRLDPDFQTEVGLDWELSDASSFSGDTLTLRNGLWVNGLVMETRYSDVLTAQLLKDTDVANEVYDAGPPVLHEYYPFYLSDFMGLIQAFIDTITAAGVIPEFEIF